MNDEVSTEASQGESSQESQQTHGNLADAVGTSISNAAEVSEEGVATSSENDWFVSPGVKGEGDKPDWHNNKQYKSIFDEAKSASDMRKKLGGFSGAPDEYSLELNGDFKDFKFNPEDPLLKDFTAFAKNSKMGQDEYSNVLQMFAGYNQLQSQKKSEEMASLQKSELEALGGAEKAKEQIDEMCQWFGQNFPNHEIQHLKDMMYFSDGFKILKSMREKMGYSNTPESAEVDDAVNRNELMDMLDDPRYLTEPEYQSMVNAKYTRSLGKK